MIVSVIKAAAFIAFFGITVGLVRSTTDRSAKEVRLIAPSICSEQQGAHQET